MVHRAPSARAGTPGSSSCPACRWSTAGPYRLLSHPNYVAVVVEGVALPLVHGAWITALCFTLLNAALLDGPDALRERRADHRATAALAVAAP